MNNKRILVIGATPHADDLMSYGGCTTLMQNFVDYCREHNYSIMHVDTRRYRYNSVANALYFATRFLFGLLVSRYVMYNVAVNGAFKLFYRTAPIAYALRRKVVFRKFAGYFLQQLEDCPVGKKIKMLSLLNKADLICFETKQLVEQAEMILQRPERVVWFSNCRCPATVAKANPSFGKRFVFISHMYESKGVDLIMQAAEGLPEDYVVDLYGSIHDEKYADPGYFAASRVKYCGALKSEEVLPTMAQYDVLLLPTYIATEGYPGILIEAMSLGIPAISTRHRFIPDLIEDGKNGILIPIKDADALREAMLSINPRNYPQFSAAAKARFDECYNSDAVNERILRRILSL